MLKKIKSLFEYYENGIKSQETFAYYDEELPGYLFLSHKNKLNELSNENGTLKYPNLFSDFETRKIVISPDLNAKLWRRGFLLFECTVALGVFFSAILIGASPQCQKTVVLSCSSTSTISTNKAGLLFN